MRAGEAFIAVSAHPIDRLENLADYDDVRHANCLTFGQDADLRTPVTKGGRYADERRSGQVPAELPHRARRSRTKRVVLTFRLIATPPAGNVGSLLC